MSTKRKNSSISRVDSFSTQTQSEKRQKSTNMYKSPNDWWHDEQHPQHQKLYVEDRGCKNASNYHDPEHECHSFDEYVAKLCHPSCAKTALGTDFYRRVNIEDDDKVYKLFPIQHIFGEIDILKTRLTKKEKKILSGFELVKRSTDFVKETLKKRENNKKKEIRVEPRLPAKFAEWPDQFKLVYEGDSVRVKKEKKLALRNCLNRRISFMKDCVYDCGSVSERYLKLHLDFIVTLQVLAAKLNA